MSGPHDAPPARKAVLFASAPAWRAERIFAVVRKRWPEYAWTVCAKAHEAGWLPADIAAERVSSSRPGLACLRRLRGSRFEIGVVCWTGESGYGRLKLMHLLTPVKENHVYNENFDAFELENRSAHPTWRQHLRYRFGPSKHGARSGIGRLFRTLYGKTLGPLLGTSWTLLRYGLWLLGWRPRALVSR